jgi:hypothetical protein
MQSSSPIGSVMFHKLLQILHIACNHRNTSKPFAAAVAGDSSSDWGAVGNGPGHYVVCLDCGKKFAYDWANMHIVH